MNNVNINTNFQVGDNNVHIGPMDRQLDQGLQAGLKQLIPSGKQVGITAVLGDGEAYNFASQVKAFLIAAGYKVDGVNQAVFAEPVNGQIIQGPKDGEGAYEIIIGNNRQHTQ